MLQLKSYQQAALDALSAFLRSAQNVGPEAAFRQATQRAYAGEMFGRVPCVCLRIPTGGGKTLLASHAIARMSADWLARDYPVALWLVPSDAIRSQTLKALQTPGHAYRAALEEKYGASLAVCGLEDVAQIAPSDWGTKAVVIVATIQSFRIEDTSTRTVYSFSEDFERHFKGLPEAALRVLRDVPDACVTSDEAEKDDTGILNNHLHQPRQSLANWLALQAPMLIVDEAHNTKTDKSFAALKRLNPSAILELTATPILGKANVLHHVSAQELSAEHMIKLPISLAEHSEGWPQAVFAAVQQQKALEAAALKDEAAGFEYVRPIVLFQAQNEGDEMPPEKLRAYLQDELHLPPEQIVVATGNTRELEGLEILSRSCPVRFVITVQALREGWDCPFAYILCSLQKLSSATAVEQLLGRVLRMPYASRRGQAALNRAYAHVCEAEFSKAAHALADRLIHGMGFEALDVASMLVQQSLEGDLFEQNRPLAGAEIAQIATNFIAVKPSDELLALPGVAQVSVGGEAQIAVTGPISAELEALLIQGVRGEKKQQGVREQIEQHNALVAAQKAPASRGAVFAPVPLLGYRVRLEGGAQSALWPLEREAVLESVELDLLTPFALELPNFDGVQEPNAFEIDMQGSRLNIRSAEAGQIVMDGVNTSITAQDLVRWLDQSLFQKLPDLTQNQRMAWFNAVINRLLHEKHHSLVQLASSRFKLAQHLQGKAADLREQAAKAQFKQLVLLEEWTIEPDWQRPHVFEAGRYPAPVLNRYSGRHSFDKHYFPVIADLKEKGEEFDCAVHIEKHPRVKHWVRNLETQPCGFWLPTSAGKFYPDFIIERADGMVIVAEYKGAHLQGADQTEKRQVGELWAKNSQGRARFGWIMKTQDGLSMAQQLEKLLG